MSKEIQVVNNSMEVAPAQQGDQFLAVIAAAARDPQVDVAKMAALLELKERIDAKQAEIEFNQAMTRLQPRLPRVKKNGKIDLGRGNPIPFAKWEDVDFIIRPILAEQGFTLSFSSKPAPNGVLMVCTLSHAAGHSRSSEMLLPPDAGPGRNALQAIGSARSYGKRYLTLDILNIVTEGEDDDGNKAFPLTGDQVEKVRTLMDACEMDPASKRKFLEFAGASTIETIQRHRFNDVMEALRKKHRQKQQGAAQ